MRKRTMRNIKFGIKVLAICGATAVTFSGIQQVHKAAERTEASCTMLPVTTTESGEIELEAEIESLEKAQTQSPERESHESLIGSMDWDADDAYLLAKIAMAEAEGEDTEGKALVILVVLNRVWSDEFPDSISKVIYQERQFSPVANGRFDKVEPDEDCYRALELVQVEGWDESHGALYFESVSASDWHRKNLSFLFKHGNHYFYTDKE